MKKIFNEISKVFCLKWEILNGFYFIVDNNGVFNIVL